MKNNNITVVILFSLVFLLVGIYGNTFMRGYFASDHDDMHHNMMHMTGGMQGMEMDDQRTVFLAMRDTIIGEQLADRQYTCCLEKPCTYCIEKTPGHGEGAACSCLEDVMNGKHPCGECIGEILEGHGNPLIAEYFATAVAEEVGMQHLGTIQEIISEKYGISVDRQI